MRVRTALGQGSWRQAASRLATCFGEVRLSQAERMKSPSLASDGLPNTLMRAGMERRKRTGGILPIRYKESRIANKESENTCYDIFTSDNLSLWLIGNCRGAPYIWGVK